MPQGHRWFGRFLQSSRIGSSPLHIERIAVGNIPRLGACELHLGDQCEP
jgi:hypothetical protein